ncbi:MAG: DUF4956 domain-containing protein [bacterium]
MTTFSDVFKSSFLDNITAISFFDMAIAIFLSFAVSMFIMLIYKKTYRGVMYSQSFCVSLMAMSLITTILILAVTSNVVLSLGMVGALSIVRFRTAIKEPLDIAFLFWSIANGIILGAGFITLAIFGSVVVGVLLVVFVNQKEKDAPYILVINCANHNSENNALRIVDEQSLFSNIKAKTVTDRGVEVTLELRLANKNTSFINAVNDVPGVHSAILVTYNGEYMG